MIKDRQLQVFAGRQQQMFCSSLAICVQHGDCPRAGFRAPEWLRLNCCDVFKRLIRIRIGTNVSVQRFSMKSGSPGACPARHSKAFRKRAKELLFF